MSLNSPPEICCDDDYYNTQQDNLQLVVRKDLDEGRSILVRLDGSCLLVDCVARLRNHLKAFSQMKRQFSSDAALL